MSLDDVAGNPSASDSAATKIVRDATCTACGCVCDDIDLTVRNQQIIAADRACSLGSRWFLAPRKTDGPACWIDGQPADLTAGIERAAQILAAARYPLVYGLSETTTESQRVAVGIADWIGGCLDTTTSVYHGPSGMAFQGVGEVTCSLGEARNRGDLIICWGTDPEESHPRHFSRYSLQPKGLFVPNGRADRTCIVVDVRKTKSAEEADLFVQVKPGSDFESLWILRAVAMGIEIDSETALSMTGQPLRVWQDLVARMKAAKFGVIFYGQGLTMTPGQHNNTEALLALTRDMNKYTRFVCRANRGQGNVSGADNVVTWRTGYPFGVNLSRGYPRFNPGEYTAAETLARKEPDAALIIASDPLAHFPRSACDHLASIPFIALDPQSTATTRAAAVAFAVATSGINTPGTVYRLDDVPIPLRPAVDSKLPSDFEILTAIEQQVKSLKAVEFASTAARYFLKTT